MEKTETEDDWEGWNFKPSGKTNDLPRDAVPCDTYVSKDRKYWKMHKPGTYNTAWKSIPLGHIVVFALRGA